MGIESKHITPERLKFARGLWENDQLTRAINVAEAGIYRAIGNPIPADLPDTERLVDLTAIAIDGRTRRANRTFLPGQVLKDLTASATLIRAVYKDSGITRTLKGNLDYFFPEMLRDEAEVYESASDLMGRRDRGKLLHKSRSCLHEAELLLKEDDPLRSLITIEFNLSLIREGRPVNSGELRDSFTNLSRQEKFTNPESIIRIATQLIAWGNVLGDDSIVDQAIAEYQRVVEDYPKLGYLLEEAHMMKYLRRLRQMVIGFLTPLTVPAQDRQSFYQLLMGL